MASDIKTLKASCHCGDAAHQIAIPSTDLPLTCYFCNCDSCRHMTGTLFLSCAQLPPAYQPPAKILDKLTAFNFSDRITQYFCTRCGAHVYAHCLPDPKNPESSENWDIMSGTLETFDGAVELKGHEYIQDTIDGGFTDFMPAVNGKPLKRWPYHPSDTELPPYWRASDPPESLGPGLRLPAHCKCKGVQFFIARPSSQSTQADRPWPDLLIPHYEQTNTKDPAHETWWLRANKTKFLAGLCSCDSCRLVSGMEITPWAFVPTIDITLDAEGKVPYQSQFGALKSYNSSEGVTRHFCSECGAIVFFEDADRARTTLLDVAVGLLSAPEGARAETWLEWRTERLSWREDAVDRAGSLVDGLENGLREFREKGYGRLGPTKEVSEALGV